MKRLSILITLLVFSMNIQSQKIYIGTYTDGTSEGVYSYNFDPNTGELSHLELAIPSVNPSFLSYGLNREVIYAVNEVNNFDQEKSGAVSSFKIEEDGSLSLLNQSSSFGAHPCHVTYDGADRIAISNYSGGTVTIFELNTLGTPDLKTVQVFNHNTNKETSHVHFSQFSEDHLYVSDLGRNSIYAYDLKDEKFSLDTDNLISIAKESGPRHFDLFDGKIYALSEYANTVTVGNIEAGNTAQIISSLPNDFQGQSYGADIHFSKDNRYLYASNRGENTIAKFKVLQDGLLEYQEAYDVHGDWPRNFAIDPTGKWLLVANQRSNNISVFEIQKSGTLNFKKSYDLGAPVCILF